MHRSGRRARSSTLRAIRPQVDSDSHHPGLRSGIYGRSVVNIALPILQSTFHATSSAIQWVVQAYALFGAALLLLGAAIGDRYGRRSTFMWGVALFAIASMGCAAPQSLGQLFAARAILRIM